MAESITVTVCFSPQARVVCELALQLQPESTLAQALALAVQQASWPQGWTAQACRSLSPSLWGRKVTWSAVLRDGDRVELCRDLRVDPKVARRERFSKQGTRRAGLFAKKRPGAAAGY